MARTEIYWWMRRIRWITQFCTFTRRQSHISCGSLWLMKRGVIGNLAGKCSFVQKYQLSSKLHRWCEDVKNNFCGKLRVDGGRNVICLLGAFHLPNYRSLRFTVNFSAFSVNSVQMAQFVGWRNDCSNFITIWISRTLRLLYKNCVRRRTSEMWRTFCNRRCNQDSLHSHR